MENSMYAIKLTLLNAMIVCHIFPFPITCGAYETKSQVGPYNAYLLADLVNDKYGSFGISIGMTTYGFSP